MQHAEHRIQSVLVHNAHIRRQAAGNPNHRYLIAFGNPRHPYRYLAVDRLAIDTPFPGNHQIRIGNQRIQM